MTEIFPVRQQIYAYNKTQPVDDFGYGEPENVDTSKFPVQTNILFKNNFIASWNKGSLFANLYQNGVQIKGSLQNDADNFTWQVFTNVPVGEKVLALDIAKAGGTYNWGGKIFSLLINGTPVLPINKAIEGSKEDPFLAQTTGTVYFDLPDNLDELKTISIKTGAGTNIELIIKNFRIYAKNDFVQKKSNKLFSPTLNQVGYAKNSPKTAVLAVEGQPSAELSLEYQIINADNKQIVKKGKVTEFNYFANAGSATAVLDFSDIRKTGKYQIIVARPGETEKTESAVFEIKDDLEHLYKAVRNDALQAYTYWTSGETGPYNSHLQDKKAVDFITKKERDVSGGWYDAGDYGKYTVTGAYSIGLMLNAYEYYPDKFNYDIGKVPLESSSRTDYFSQVKTECDWLLKMQNPDGSVNHKATSEKWPQNSTAPEDDNFQKTLMPVSSTATADFAAALAKASRLFEKTDPDSAKMYLAAAQNAWSFLEENKKLIMTQEKYNGSEFGGPYTDDSDKDERLWAAVELFKATKATRFQKYIEANLSTALQNLSVDEKNGVSTVSDWQNVNFLAVFSYYQSDTASAKLKNEIKKWAENYGDTLIAIQKKNPYGVAVAGKNNQCDWGSNSVVLTTALSLLMINKITAEKKYGDSARVMVDYIFGNNPLNISYVTGYGFNAAKDPHFRPHMSGRYPLPKGYLVGGPNSVNIGGDSLLAGLWQKPGYLRYIDKRDSWATNEVAINWNAALVAVMSILSGLK